ncbi:MAG: HAD family phosphatase [Pseudothermotoga sp.]|uniref:Cof-type HAD-IIB family hydrolase n=1 Tax=Pseudothermotoga sp. TaxID=2033661 RepID=UPI000E91AC8E|nr:HAD family phosphatase [Pseudothermotoga sp.]HBT38696.1 Cof-type HAD-IIB family hydrolase [Pseudothermotoga sp.]HCO98209.1 Cof-type HAD-IIB family hydrolase [Pseudothermotoga sp.]
MVSLIKLVCIDLDGTLLDSKKHISQRNAETIRRVVESGVHVTIFTGRSFGSAAHYLKELDIRIPAVFQNGALIIDPVSMKIFRSIELDANLAKRFVELARAYSVYPVVYESFFFEKDMAIENTYEGAFEQYFQLNSHRIRMVEDLSKELSQKKSVVEIALVGKIESVNRVIEEASAKLKNGYTVVENQKREREAFVEIFGPGVGKERALEFFLEMYAVTLEEVMYIGDNLNDASIMRMVGTSVAMMNAPDEIKMIAKHVTDSNDESGVAKALERLLLRERVGE